MSKKPVLVLQPRRLGDLILTFPLLNDLRRLYPGHSLHVMANPLFYEPLLPFSPPAAYFPPKRLEAMRGNAYEAIINLGGSPEAAGFTATANAELKLGMLEKDGNFTVSGYWQLYRESLTLNNRHNIFHWADLFRLDLPGFQPVQGTVRKAPGSGRIGIFTGASDPAKRPPAQFWASLANHLAGSGFKPILLGGKAETGLGQEIMAAGAKAANFCGRTSLAQLAAIIKSLDLLITPDTGPMHLADLLGAPVLNLSMGNVNPAETGPLGHGQHILAAAMSCSGCWQCRRRKLFCREAFNARQVAKTAAAIAKNDGNIPVPAGLELLGAGRDPNGLYRLYGHAKNARLYLDNFWQAAFLEFNGRAQAGQLQTAARELGGNFAPVARRMRENMGTMLAILASSGKYGSSLPGDFWQNQPLHSRLFAGSLQMMLQNADQKRSAFGEALARIDLLQSTLARAC